MLLSPELLSHQLRQFSDRELWKRNAMALSNHHCWRSPHQGSRNVGGEETSNSTHSCTHQSPKQRSTSRLSLTSTTYIVPMFQIWMRLNSLVPHSETDNVLHSMRRLRLEQQPLQQNLRQATSMLWRRFWGSTNMESEYSERSTQTESWIAIIRNFVSLRFISLSKKLEKALSPASSGLSSVTESAAMEIISLSYIRNKLNSVAIDYILNNEDQLNKQSATD